MNTDAIEGQFIKKAGGKTRITQMNANQAELGTNVRNNGWTGMNTDLGAKG